MVFEIKMGVQSNLITMLIYSLISIVRNACLQVNHSKLAHDNNNDKKKCLLIMQKRQCKANLMHS